MRQSNCPEELHVRHTVLPVLAMLSMLATAPASAGLIGTTASATAPGLGVTPSSATVVSGGNPEFTFFVMQGDVDDASFTLSVPSGTSGGLVVPSNAIVLTIEEVIADITVTLGGAVPGLNASAFSFSGNTLTVNIGAAGSFTSGEVFRVDFTFANSVPEGSSLALLGAGLLGLGAARRRHRST